MCINVEDTRENTLFNVNCLNFCDVHIYVKSDQKAPFSYIYIYIYR